MNTRICLLLGLAALAAGPAFGAGADGAKILMVVVAEQTNPEANSTPPSPDHPARYVAYDAGYIEAGDPVAGEEPPPAAAVAQALRGTLAAQNFLPASASSAPSLLVVYHWGGIRPDSHQIPHAFDIQPNLRARIALIAPTRQAGEIENYLLNRRMGTINPAFRVPGMLGIQESELLNLAGDDRYFVIVSAYDFAAFTRRETKLLWRLKASTRGPGESMAEALPALLSGAAPYFGRDLTETLILKAPLFPAGPAVTGVPTPQEFPPPPGVARELDDSYLHHLLYQEHVEFSGEFFADDKAGNSSPLPTAATASGESFLPPALAARINAYEHEKSVLQDALSVQIKAHTPGADTHQTIDNFNQKNAGRIAALTTEREAIRDELARLAAANTDAAAGKSLSTLLNEFAAGVQKMEASPGADSP